MMAEACGGEPRLRPDVDEIKQCCARLYESEIVARLLGESFHPGGAQLTERLGQWLGLTTESWVVDAASGKGTSAPVLAQWVGCSVIGVHLRPRNLSFAAARAERAGPGGCRSVPVR